MHLQGFIFLIVTLTSIGQSLTLSQSSIHVVPVVAGGLAVERAVAYWDQGLCALLRHCQGGDLGTEYVLGPDFSGWD